MDDLVTQLTAMKADYAGTRAGTIISAALDRITALEAALKPFSRIASHSEHLPSGAGVSVNINRCRDARQALGAPHDPQA